MTILPIAISGSESEITINVAGPLSTANIEVLEEYKKVDWALSSLKKSEKVIVNAYTLSNLFERVIGNKVDLLVVDVEGYEESVFSTFNELRIKPSMIIVELSELHRDLESSVQGSVKVREILEEFGYKIIFKDSINTIFVETDLFNQVFHPTS